MLLWGFFLLLLCPVVNCHTGFQQLKPRYSSDLSFEKMASTFKTAMEQYEHALEECMRKERSTEPARAGEKSVFQLVLGPSFPRLCGGGWACALALD